MIAFVHIIYILVGQLTSDTASEVLRETLKWLNASIAELRSISGKTHNFFSHHVNSYQLACFTGAQNK